jgi:hypothetical protein
LSEKPPKLNSQRATNKPRRPLQKKEGEERKTAGTGAKTEKTKGEEGRSNRKGEERRHRD